MATEIERKFLIDALPDGLLDGVTAEPIRQGYLVQEASREIRVRGKGRRFFLTEKRGSGLSREEVEIEIEEVMFAALWPLTEGARLEKSRSRVEHQGQGLEIDVYHGSLAPLVVMEAEFSSEDAARAFTPPPFAGRDITEDKRYKNARLATAGQPPDE